MLNERELPDDYPIHTGFLYVIDGRVWTSKSETTVGQVKEVINYDYTFTGEPEIKSFTTCDIGGRDLWHLAV